MTQLAPHQQRVLDEKRELDERLSKLDAFILDNPLYLQLPADEQDRMTRQSKAMAAYSGVLAERIEAFDTPAATPPQATAITLPVVDPGPDSLEREIQAKANNGPRVTPQALLDEIVSEHYFTGADGVLGAYRNGGDVHPVGGTPSQATHLTLGLLTICVLVLRNGFTVVGHSACVSPENFDADVGRKIARQNAVDQIWPLLGFRLRDQLSGS